MGFLNKVKSVADRVNNFTGKATDILGFFGGDVVGLVEGRKFPYRNHFHEMLNTWDFSPASRNLWIVHIERFPLLALMHEDSTGRSLLHKLELEGTGTTGKTAAFKIAKNVKTLQRYEYQDSPGGCLFAQGAVIPREGYSTSTVQVKNARGLLPGIVGGDRTPLDALRIQFRESNTSFLDNIIRPWVMMTSQFGLVARPISDIKNMKTTVHIYQLGKTLADTPNVHRKVWSYYNCTPTAITDNAELTYDMDTQNEFRTTTWAYTHYSLEQLPDLPLQLVLDQIMGGALMNVIDKAFGGKVKSAVKKYTEPIDSVKNAGKVIGNIF